MDHIDYVDFPSTPHIYYNSHFRGEKVHAFYTDEASDKLLEGKTVKLEEKLDGSNVGIGFEYGQLVLQSRGHKLGSHSQYDLLKNWAEVMRYHFQEIIGETYVVFGEWMFAKHTVPYDNLPHYFIGTGVWDKEEGRPISTERRYALFEEMGIPHAPLLYTGEISGYDQLAPLLGRNSEFGSTKIEGLYGRIEKEGGVEGYFKLVNREFWLKRQQTQFPKNPVQNTLREGIGLSDLFWADRWVRK
ncbi:TPA: RNA ligase family protein [Candidatus Woesearchaeota archaeon]|nr:hypothetical protein QT06_C0001G0497 [archaeon GW2011_AR15]MBS3103808.1 RNA ligase family protein [Candidatus Woesearchaeota archaeon]HIH41902.1 RNA ligase family protein [Candidatus Woesearchaeota archaeon]